MGMLYSHIGEAETEVLPRFSTAELDAYAATYNRIHEIDDPDEYMAPLRQGGGLAEQHVTHAMRRRGWLSPAVLARQFADRIARRTRRTRGRHA